MALNYFWPCQDPVEIMTSLIGQPSGLLTGFDLICHQGTSVMIPDTSSAQRELGSITGVSMHQGMMVKKRKPLVI